MGSSACLNHPTLLTTFAATLLAPDRSLALAHCRLRHGEMSRFLMHHWPQGSSRSIIMDSIATLSPSKSDNYQRRVGQDLRGCCHVGPNLGQKGDHPSLRPRGRRGMPLLHNHLAEDHPRGRCPSAIFGVGKATPSIIDTGGDQGGPKGGG
jgi:hypothetical protein